MGQSLALTLPEIILTVGALALMLAAAWLGDKAARLLTWIAIAIVVLWMGVYPESFLAPMRNDVGLLLARIERAAPEGDARLVRGAPSAPGAPNSHDIGPGHGAAPAAAHAPEGGH